MMNVDMHDKDEPTVEATLAVLSQALGKASEDLCAVRSAIDLARVDMASHNGSHTRDVIRDAELRVREAELSFDFARRRRDVDAIDVRDEVHQAEQTEHRCGGG